MTKSPAKSLGHESQGNGSEMDERRLATWKFDARKEHKEKSQLTPEEISSNRNSLLIILF
jgi:hypothetical protein